MRRERGRGRERESKGKRNNMRRERGRERETEEVINLIKSLHVATLQKHAHTHIYVILRFLNYTIIKQYPLIPVVT